MSRAQFVSPASLHPLQGSSLRRVSPPSPSRQLHSQSHKVFSKLQLLYNALASSSSPVSSSEISSSWASDLASSSTEKGGDAGLQGEGVAPARRGEVKPPSCGHSRRSPPTLGVGTRTPPHPMAKQSGEPAPTTVSSPRMQTRRPATPHPRGEAALPPQPPRDRPQRSPSPHSSVALTGDVLPAEIDRSSSTLEHEGDGREQLQTFEADLQRVRAQSPPRPAAHVNPCGSVTGRAAPLPHGGVCRPSDGHGQSEKKTQRCPEPHPQPRDEVPGVKPSPCGQGLHAGGLPSPWGAPRSAAPRWAPACCLQKCFSSQRPPRAARPRPRLPGRSAEPSREPMAESLAVSRPRCWGTGSLRGALWQALELTVLSSTRCSKRSSSSFTTQLRAPAFSWQPTGTQHHLHTRVLLPRASQKQRGGFAGHTHCEKGETPPGSPRGTATASPLHQASPGCAGPYPTAQQQVCPLTAAWRREKSCSSSTADPTPATSSWGTNTRESGVRLLGSGNATHKHREQTLQPQKPRARRAARSSHQDSGWTSPP